MELTIEQALQQGIAAHKEGKLQEAEGLYRSILQAQPLHSDANHNLGVIAVSVNKADLALPLFKAALEANPKIEQFWLSYIDALIKEKEFDNAKQVLEQAKNQGVAEEKLNILETQLTPTAQVNEPKLAVQNKSLSLSQKRKKLSEQKKRKKKATKQNLKANNPSQQQLTSLLECYQNRRFNDAEKLAVSITNEFPKHQFGWKVLGAVLQQTGRVIDSLTAIQKSVKLAPQDAEAHSNLGNALKELGRLDEAEASYTQAIALKPDFAEAHYNLGITLQELGRLDEAEASYTQAIALKPDLAEAHSNLGVTLKELGRLDEAEASYSQVIALKPDLAEAHYNLGITLKELGRLEEAKASYTQAIVLKPDYAEVHSNLGVTLLELGRLDEAETSCRQAIALKPDYAEAHYNLGTILQELGRLDEAEASHTQSIALESDLALAHYGLGKVLYIKGYEDLALKSIVKANEIEPQLKDYELMLRVMEVRKSRKGNEAVVSDTSNISALTGLISSPLILNRVVEPELIISLYEMNSIQLDKTKRVGLLASGKADPRFGNGIVSPDFNLFKDARSIIQKLAEDLTKIMMKALKSDIYIYDSFFNILSAGGGTTPHAHLTTLDKNIALDLGKQKYSLVYYLSVGDQNCREPGILKLYEPGEDILPCEGMIMIFPASRRHSAVYGGKTDRVMIGVNFYSL
jgi:tetratricopeptide (TPR) repeat protein